MSSPAHSHPSSSPSSAHVRFDVSKEATADISYKEKAIESTIHHARTSSSSSPHSPLPPHPLTDDEDPTPPFPVLASLLSSSSAFHIEYHHYLSNHLPHALISLYHLGASARRLMAYSADYSQKLEPARGREEERPEVKWAEAVHYNGLSAPPAPVSQPIRITRENWKQYIGHKKHWLAYLAFFQAELRALTPSPSSSQLPPAAALTSQATSPAEVAAQSLTPEQAAGVKALVSLYLPQLIDGASHSALHPLIHTGWGLAGGAASLPTVCEGLAYCCYSFHSLDGHTGGYSPATIASTPHYNDVPLLSSLHRLADVFSPHMDAMAESIRRIPYCEMNVGAFQRALVWLGIEHPRLLLEADAAVRLHGVGAEVVDDLFLHVLFLFAVSGNDFFMLHTVTGLWALSHALPLLEAEDARVALRYGVKYVLATFVVQRMPGLQSEAMQMALKAGELEEAARWVMANGGRREGRRWEQVSWEELKAAAIDCFDEHTIKSEKNHTTHRAASPSWHYQ